MSIAHVTSLNVEFRGLHGSTPLESISTIQRRCCCCSATKSYLSLCDPMNCSTPGLPGPHHLPESTQVHWIGDATQRRRGWWGTTQRQHRHTLSRGEITAELLKNGEVTSFQSFSFVLFLNFMLLYLFIYFLDLGTRTRDWTQAPAVEANHWCPREVLIFFWTWMISLQVSLDF